MSFYDFCRVLNLRSITGSFIYVLWVLYYSLQIWRTWTSVLFYGTSRLFWQMFVHVFVCHCVSVFRWVCDVFHHHTLEYICVYIISSDTGSSSHPIIKHTQDTQHIILTHMSSVPIRADEERRWFHNLNTHHHHLHHHILNISTGETTWNNIIILQAVWSFAYLSLWCPISLNFTMKSSTSSSSQNNQTT